MDDGRVTALILLDLSAAFNTTDHTVLLRRLGNWFGVSGKALDWFKSYLTGRSQRIKLGNCLSSRSDLSFGVPQGSVLGPLLFTLYTTPLSSLVSGHAIPHHLYADDSQLYISFSSGDSAAALNGLQACLASVQSWMSTNKLKLNSDKNVIPPHWEWTATEQISFYVSNRAFGCWNLPSKICSQSWSDLWQQLQLPLTYICNLQFMHLPHPGSMVYSLSLWSG